MADHSKPILTDNYTDVLSQIRGRLDDQAKHFDPAVTSATNIPTGAIRWDSASNKDQKWTGTTWVDKSDTYNFNQINVSGNVGIGTTTPSRKLTVASETSGLPTLGTGSGGLFLSSINGGYGLFGGVNGLTGDSWLQAMRNDAATAYNLVLQPSGGNLLVGNTNGTSKITASGVIESTTGGFKFPDGTTQTNAVSTTVGAVGSHAMMGVDNTLVGPLGSILPGVTHPGSELRYKGSNGSQSSTVPSGTWRCMGYSSDGYTATLWLRIS